MDVAQLAPVMPRFRLLQATRGCRRGALACCSWTLTPPSKGYHCPRSPPEAPPAPYLSMSPTTKNIEPRIAIRSGTRQPGSNLDSACTLANEAVRSLGRHG